MTVTRDVSQTSSQSEGLSRGGGEETESRIHKQFIEWVSAHEEQVQEIICHSKQFSGEPFCGAEHVSTGEDKSLWRGSANFL
jgi:hypothetical protein